MKRHSVDIQHTALDLSHRGLNIKAIIEIWRGHSPNIGDHLETLKLGFNNICDEGMPFLSLFLKSNFSLRCLDLSFNNIGDIGMACLSECLKTNRSIETLLLSGNFITAKGFLSLKEALLVNSTITTLHLGGNGAHAQGCKYLSEAMEVNRSLRVLVLNGNVAGEDGASCIARGFTSSKALKHLNLSDNKIGDKGLCALSEALHRQKGLKKLELSFNNISHLSLENLSYALWNYTSMSVLLLDNNKIGDQGALLLASCVSSMNLSHLNVGFNDIGANGIAALLQACLLPVNSTAMTILNISGSVINADVAKLLADLLVKNRTLNELYLDRTNIGSAGERLIAAGIASNRRCALTSFTGFDLGEVLVTLGSPPALATMANKHALRHLADMWRALEHGEVIVAPNYDCPTAPTTATTSTNCSSSVEGEEDPLRPGKIVLRKPVLESAATPVSLRKLSEDILESDKPPTSVQAPLLSSGTSPSSPSPPANMSDIHKYSAALQRIAFLPFVNADLWSLHQYYFSPVAALGGSPKLDASGCLSSDSEDDPIPCADSRRRSWAEQPKKKQGNRLTMARIAGYPRLKNLIETIKMEESEQKMLSILRQLKFLEDNAEDLNDFDLESVLLESL